MNRKLIIILVFLSGVAGLLTTLNLRRDDSKKEPPVFQDSMSAVTAFINNVSESKYEQAYSLISSKDQSKEDFSLFMSSINKAVDLEKCEIKPLEINNNTSTSLRLVEVACPYKKEELKRSVHFIFSLSITSNSATIQSYTHSYY